MTLEDGTTTLRPPPEAQRRLGEIVAGIRERWGLAPDAKAIFPADVTEEKRQAERELTAPATLL